MAATEGQEVFALRRRVDHPESRLDDATRSLGALAQLYRRPSCGRRSVAARSIPAAEFASRGPRGEGRDDNPAIWARSWHGLPDPRGVLLLSLLRRSSRSKRERPRFVATASEG